MKPAVAAAFPAADRLRRLRYNRLVLVHLLADADLRGLGYQVALGEGRATRGVIVTCLIESGSACWVSAISLAVACEPSRSPNSSFWSSATPGGLHQLRSRQRRLDSSPA